MATGSPQKNCGYMEEETMCASCATGKGMARARANGPKWAFALEMDWRSTRRLFYTAEGRRGGREFRPGKYSCIVCSNECFEEVWTCGLCAAWHTKEAREYGRHLYIEQGNRSPGWSGRWNRKWGEEEYSQYAWKFMYKHGRQVSLKPGSYDGEEGIKDTAHHWPETPAPVGLRV